MYPCSPVGVTNKVAVGSLDLEVVDLVSLGSSQPFYRLDNEVWTGASDDAVANR